MDESETGSANLYGPTPKASVREADQWKGFGGTGRFPRTRTAESDVEAHVQDVPVLNHVRLAFEALEAGPGGLRM